MCSRFSCWDLVMYICIYVIVRSVMIDLVAKILTANKVHLKVTFATRRHRYLLLQVKPIQASDVVSPCHNQGNDQHSSRERFAGAVWLSLCTRFADKPLHLCCCGLPASSHFGSRATKAHPITAHRAISHHHTYTLNTLPACRFLADSSQTRVNLHTRHIQDTRSSLHLPEGDFAPFFGGGRSLKEPHDSQWKLPAAHFA